MPRYQIEFPDNGDYVNDRLKPDARITRISYHAKNTQEAWAIFRTIETFFTSQNYAFIEMQGDRRSDHSIREFQYKCIGTEPTIESRCPHCGWIDYLAMRAAGTGWQCAGCGDDYIVCDDCTKCNYHVACLSRDNYER